MLPLRSHHGFYNRTKHPTMMNSLKHSCSGARNYRAGSDSLAYLWSGYQYQLVCMKGLKRFQKIIQSSNAWWCRRYSTEEDYSRQLTYLEARSINTKVMMKWAVKGFRATLGRADSSLGKWVSWSYSMQQDEYDFTFFGADDRNINKNWREE